MHQMVILDSSLISGSIQAHTLKTDVMNQEQLSAILASLTGHLATNDDADVQQLNQLQHQVAQAILQQDPSTIKTQDFIFERSDLFLSRNVSGKALRPVSEIIKEVKSKKDLADIRVFVRTVPVRTTQIAGGSGLLSAGARVNTIGPVFDLQGLPKWFDFVTVKKLIALYVQGKTQPILLFDAIFSQKRLRPLNAKPVELTKNFKIDPETIWIQTRLFAPGTAENQYVGLRVKGGTITLDADPFMAGDKLTIPASCKVTCDLQLEQNNTINSDPSSEYGADAREAKFDMPDNFKFHVKGNTKEIHAVGQAKWKVYGQDSSFRFNGNQTCVYNAALNRLAIPMSCSHSTFAALQCLSPFFSLQGAAPIVNSWWTIPSAVIDIQSPLEADGNGGIVIECADGFSVSWTNLQHKRIGLPHSFIIGEPGRIGITSLNSDGSGAQQQFDAWKDELNPFGSSISCRFRKNAALVFNTLAKGDEMVFSVGDLNLKTDRPVTVNGEAVPVRSSQSAFMLAVSKLKKLLIVVDENMLWDNKLPADKIPKVKPVALALHNALFTVTPPNSLVIFAECSNDFQKLSKGTMYLGFGLFSYLPTLPDPYAANLGLLESQFKSKRAAATNMAGGKRESAVWMWLFCQIQWKAANPETDKVKVSFHFAPLQAPLQIEKQTSKKKSGNTPSPTAVPADQLFGTLATMSSAEPISFHDHQSHAGVNMAEKRDPLASFSMTDFALLDVSSNAGQMGVSFAKVNNGLQQIIARKFDVDITDEQQATVFPIQVSGLDVVTAGMNAQAFTVPSIAWEPVFNLTQPQLKAGQTDSNGNALPPPYDPPIGFNYYQNDGIATRIGNLSRKQVPLSPIPLSAYLVDTYKRKEDGKTFAMFNLPFGMLALAVLDNNSTQSKKATIDLTQPDFENGANGGIQLELTAGTSFSPDDSRMFEGFTIQLMNINHADGSPSFSSTLGATPTLIFNNEFYTNLSNLPARPGVPLTNIGLSGYGASMFSNWTNSEALFAQVSQAQFNVVTGRTNHEVVQVKSMLYPWGIRVVRTITIFRLANGYIGRIDSGWQAESEGRYDFSWQKPILGPDNKTVVGKTPMPNPFEFHPGMVRGLVNVRNIKEQPKIFTRGLVMLYAVTFDADVELEHVTEGGQQNKVPTRSVVGYVQISPAGEPIQPEDLTALLASENNSIGGSISCMIKVAGTTQRMKLDRFDVNTSVNAANQPIFVAAARGSLLLPKDGSWSLVKHARKTGDVSPLPEQLSVPLIRVGKWVKNQVVSAADVSNMMRIAYPGDLLKAADDATINFGILQNMGSQKVLFMTPGFKQGVESLLSKTPPLLADAFRLMNSKGIFPNIGSLDGDFGQAISLLKGIGAANNPLDAFQKINVPDAGDVFNLLQLKAKEEAGKILDQGYELAKGAVNGVANKALKFDLPSFDYPLINLDGKLVIMIQYKASSKPKNQSAKNYVGKFDFDVDSFANDLSETWKGRMNNLAMVVSIGPLKDVMKIKGNFNSQKGKETDLGSPNASDNPALNLPLPELEFSDALEPVIKILEILASLSSGEYGDALKKGLKVAMSNSANIWEYKFEANKDIPLVRFPPTKELYESPQTPLKLEASLGIGVFFNAALKVTTDPAQLLPTAGAYFKFHGGLQVMCVSVGVGTIYAVGNVDLKLEADTSPKIAVTMAFGFGAQITVGLPVVGRASILFMVGVEIYADSGEKVRITAFMLFKGQAELLGGLVSVTITIEARGSIEKAGPGTPTTCMAQVTFAIDISIFMIIDISFSESWEESRQIA
jgi:hypothetical protein